MLIVALVLAVIGLAALVTAVVTSNELIAWVCIGASAFGVLLLIVDAIRERQAKTAPALRSGPGDLVDAADDDAADTADELEDDETVEFDDEYPHDAESDSLDTDEATDEDAAADPDERS